VLAGLLAVVACGSPERGGREDVPPPPESATPPAPAATRELRVGDAGVRLHVPLDWTEASKRERDSFAATAMVLQPPTTHAFEMMCPPEGCDAGILIGTEETYAEPDPFHGWTIEEIATWSTSAPNGHGRAPTEASAARHGTGMEVILRYGTESIVRQRLWVQGGSLAKAICFCRGSACRAQARCVLADAPQDATSITAPLLGSKAPVRLSLPGIGHVEASPSLVPATEEQLAPIRSLENSPPFDQEVGLLSMDADLVLGMLTLSAQTRPMGGRCIAAQRAELLRSMGDGELSNDGTRYVVSYGDLERWARRVMWCEGDELHTVSCDCVGSPCALARRTCTLLAEG